MNLRVEALKRAAKTEERKAAIEKAAKRLVDLTGMGKEYQVLGMTAAARRGVGDAPRVQEVEEVWPFIKVEVGENS